MKAHKAKINSARTLSALLTTLFKIAAKAPQKAGGGRPGPPYPPLPSWLDTIISQPGTRIFSTKA